MSNDDVRPNQVQQRKEHVCLCLDRSGSMTGPMPGTVKSRIQATAEAATAILSVSDPALTDYSLVEFESLSTVVVPRSSDYLLLMGKVWLKPGGGTQMQLGISQSLQQNPDRIILLSDGGPTCTEDELWPVVDTAINLKVKIDTIAIGGASDEIMQQIAKRTGGIFRRCDDPTQLAQHFMQLETRARLTYQPTN